MLGTLHHDQDTSASPVPHWYCNLVKVGLHPGEQSKDDLEAADYFDAGKSQILVTEKVDEDDVYCCFTMPMTEFGR